MLLKFLCILSLSLSSRVEDWNKEIIGSSFKLIIRGKTTTMNILRSIHLNPLTHFTFVEFNTSFYKTTLERLAKESKMGNYHPNSLYTLTNLVRLWLLNSETEVSLSIDELGLYSLSQKYFTSLRDHFEPDSFNPQRPFALYLMRPPELFIRYDRFLVEPHLVYRTTRKAIEAFLSSDNFDFPNLFFAAHYFSLADFFASPSDGIATPVKPFIRQQVNLYDCQLALDQRINQLKLHWDSLWVIGHSFLTSLYSLYCYLSFLKYSVFLFGQNYPKDLFSQIKDLFSLFIDRLKQIQSSYQNITYLTGLYVGKTTILKGFKIYLANVQVYVLPNIEQQKNHYTLLKKIAKQIQVTDLHIYLLQPNQHTILIKETVEEKLRAFFRITEGEAYFMDDDYIVSLDKLSDCLNKLYI